MSIIKNVKELDVYKRVKPIVVDVSESKSVAESLSLIPSISKWGNHLYNSEVSKLKSKDNTNKLYSVMQCTEIQQGE